MRRSCEYPVLLLSLKLMCREDSRAGRLGGSLLLGRLRSVVPRVRTVFAGAFAGGALAVMLGLAAVRRR